MILDSRGKIVFLGRELGRGGEGAVYEIADNPALVAKIYHEPVSDDKAEKLRQMVALNDEKLSKLAAWVIETLHGEPRGAVVGFLMPRVGSGKAIHELYNPRSRRQFFPEADWRFLIRAAANSARAFAVVHGHNHAVADVNHGNIVIAADATARLIDCDSYHINAPSKSFLCEVGVATHTPPELQNRSLRDVTRTANHDNFGLAVLIFQLLMMGRHPFSGQFLGADADEENTLENSIANRRFAYGENALSRQMRQPPGTLPLAAVSPKIAAMFERAFIEIENRPTAREWATALDELEQNLCECRINTAHFYYRELPKCPWCALEAETGVLFFPPRYTGNFDFNGNFDVLTLGRLIDAIKPPDLSEFEQLAIRQSPPFLSAPIVVTEPSSLRVKNALKLFYQQLVTFLFFLSLAVIFLVHFDLSVIFQFSIFGFWISSAVIGYIASTTQKEIKEWLEKLQQQSNRLDQELSGQNLLQPFENARDNLRLAIKQYKELPAARERQIKEARDKQFRQQLDFYLRGFPISKSGIVGLSNVYLTDLRTNHILTAAEVSSQNLNKIGGLNFTVKRKLLDWRADLERQFVFAPPVKLSEESAEEISLQTVGTRRALEATVKTEFPRLQKLAQQIQQRGRVLVKQKQTLDTELTQAKSDFARVENLHTIAIVLTIIVAVLSFVAAVLLK